MTPKSLRIEKAFRMPLPSEMGRDALFVDIQLCPTKQGQTHERIDIFRFCTTHLESLVEGTCLRKRQLELISKKLQGDEGMTNIIAGLVAGDMNAIHDTEHILHRVLGLRDAWEDTLFTHPPNLDGKADLSFGRTNGHTWGYQSDGRRWAPSCFDKFLYTGCIGTVPLCKSQRFEGTVRRLGISLTVNLPLKVGPLGEYLLKADPKAWVSDHFGIALGIKIGS
jgi:hypothetical protein